MFFIPLFESQLKTKYIGRAFVYLKETTSTNQNTIEAIKKDTHGYTCLAEKQLNGVGRRNTKWHSTPYKSLTFSFLIRENTLYDNRYLSLLVATSISEAYKLILGKELKFKFPNDLILNNKKVGGVLINKIKYKSTNFFVGVGVNVNDSIDDLKIKGSTSISIELKQSIQREPFLAFILNFFEKNYLSCKIPIDEWMNGCCHVNKLVKFHIGDSVYSGIFKSLNQDGSAKIEINNELKNISSAIFEL
jgi:BirA family biotin operon repressor/biotin-[acetyl-CoA-carboxylase] ligase